jgi:DNA-binding transcriptional MocR family regulator
MKPRQSKRRDHRGRTERTEHYTKMIRATMETPAWRALSTTAQALYVWLKLEWRGPAGNNNGRIRLSVRDAATKLGVSKDTAAGAFRELQAKGFIVMTEHATLGASGEAKSPAFAITELAMPHGDGPEGQKLFKAWQPGSDFPVHKTSSNNPSGRNQKTEPCHQNLDSTVIKIGTKVEKLSRK